MLLLVLNTVYRSKSLACDWLKRYYKDVMDGLKNRQKSSGKPTELSEEAGYQIKKELKESNRGWTTKQIEEFIVKKNGIKYHYNHIYCIISKWFQTRKASRYMLILDLEEKEIFKKISPETCE
jgi:transposase